MAAVSNILYLNGGITTGIGTADTVTAPGTWTFSGTGTTSFSGNVGIAGNLTVSGDIVARDTTNVTIKDPFIDLGIGNSTTTFQAGGFTVQMGAASGVTAATIKRFVTATQFEINDTGATALAADQVIALTGLPEAFAANEGFYVVDSVSGTAPQVVNIKGTGYTGQGSTPFIQTAFSVTTTTQIDAGAAFQTAISALAFANGVAFPDSGGTPYAAGTLLRAYSAAAVLSDFTDSGDWSMVTPPAAVQTLQAAYNGGATIATAASTPIAFTLTSGGFNVQSGAVNFGGAGLTDLTSFEVAATGAITLGGTSTGAISLGNDAGTGAVNIASGAGTRTVNIGTGSATQTLNFGTNSLKIINFGSFDSSSSTEIRSGTGHITLAQNSSGQIRIGADAGTGAILIGESGLIQFSGNGRPINIGTQNAPFGINQTISIATGSAANQTVLIGTGAAAKTVTVGSTNTTSTTTVQSGSNGVNINASNNQPTNINTGTSTGTVTIGGSAAQTIAIGTGGSTKTVTVGSTTGASTTTVQSGSGGLVLTASNGDFSIESTGGLGFVRSAGPLQLASLASGLNISAAGAALTLEGPTFGFGQPAIVIGEFSDEINIGVEGITNSQTIAIGSTLSGPMVAPKTVLLGSTGGSSATTIRGGTGNITLDAGGGDVIATVTNAVQIADGKQLRFYEPTASGSNYTALQAQAQAADITYTLPAAQASANQYLQNDGSGNLVWSTVAADTLQSAYDAGNSITTASTTPILFTLADGGFDVESGAVNFGSGALTAVTTFAVEASSTVDIDAVGALSLNSSGAAINIGNDAVAQDINVGTQGARTISLGSTAATAAGVEAATISIGAGAIAHTVNIANDGTTAQVINIGSSNGASDVNINAGTAGVSIDAAGNSNFSVTGADLTLSTITSGDVKLTVAGSQHAVMVDSLGGVGILCVNKSANTLQQGTLVALKANANPASASVPEVVECDANATEATECRLFGVVVTSGGVATDGSLKVATFAGSMTRVTFGSAPASTNVGDPVYVSTTAGEATLTAPSGSGEAVMQVGYLVSAPGTAGGNIVVLAPQFIAQIP